MQFSAFPHGLSYPKTGLRSTTARNGKPSIYMIGAGAFIQRGRDNPGHREIPGDGCPPGNFANLYSDDRLYRPQFKRFFNGCKILPAQHPKKLPEHAFSVLELLRFLPQRQAR